MVIDIIITMVLTGAMANGTKMRVAGRSKARCFASSWKITDKADNSAMN
jgi:hypothetical protein